MLNRSNDKILIGIPTTGMVDWQFASSIAMMQYPCPSIFMWTIRTMIDEARNMIARKSIEKDGEYTHVLMMDDDQIFDPDALNKLYERDVDVCSGLIFQRRDPYMPCVYKELSDGFHPFYPSEFSEIDGCGTGFVLFKTSVFKKINHPWFETYYDSSQEHWSVDLDFSKKLKSIGIKMYVDPSISIGHLGDKPVIDNNFINKHIKETGGNFMSKENFEKLQAKPMNVIINKSN